MSSAADREDWKNTILAGLANYIDAGSIVAGAVALALLLAAARLRDPIAARLLDLLYAVTRCDFAFLNNAEIATTAA